MAEPELFKMAAFPDQTHAYNKGRNKGKQISICQISICLFDVRAPYENENKNTARKTTQDVMLSKSFSSEKTSQNQKNCRRYSWTLRFKEFILSVRKNDGSYYEPSFLSIERYLKKLSYGYSIINSIEFTGTREVLKAKQNALKSSGKGAKQTLPAGSRIPR